MDQHHNTNAGSRSSHILSLVVILCVITFSGCGGSDSTPAAVPGGSTLTGAGAAWTAVTAPSGTSTWRGVAYGSNIWVAVGNGFRARSDSGTSWTSTAVPSAYNFQSAVAFANGVFIAPSQLGVNTSSNGTAWTNQTLSAAENLAAIAFGNGIWVIVDDRFLTSDVLAFMVSTTNGVSWSQTLTGISYTQPTSVAFGNNQFVTVGYGGLVANSANGTAWTQQNLGSTSDLGLQAVTYAGGKFVAVTNSGKAYSSTDGVTWTKVTVTVNALYGVSYGNGVFVAVGAAGSLFTSPDAVTWTRRAWSGPNADFEDVAFGNSQFVAVGNSFAVSR